MSIYTCENFDNAFEKMLGNEVMNKVGVSLLKCEIEINAQKELDNKPLDELLFDNLKASVYFVFNGWLKIQKDSMQEMMFEMMIKSCQDMISFGVIRQKFIDESNINPSIMDWWYPSQMPGVDSSKRWILKSTLVKKSSGFMPSFIPAFNDITVPEMLWKEISKAKNQSFIVYQGE